MRKAQSFEELQMKVKNLISKKIVVGHGLGSDFKALKLKHPRKDIRDTAIYFQNKLGGKPSLAKLAQERLGIKIQSGEHSSIQDARAALRIYLGGTSLSNIPFSFRQQLISVRSEWEGKLKAKKDGKVGKQATSEYDAGINIDEELKHEENSKHFNGENDTDNDDSETE